MALRHIIQFRKFSTSRTFHQSMLSDSYKSKKLWDTRFSCPLLGGDEQIIKSINSKIILDKELSNIEIDIFINIAVPNLKETAQLQESAKLVRKLRKGLYADTLMPSTPHAMCRLFLESDRLETLAKILSNRVDYGIFPDFFVMNLLIDKSIEKKNFPLAAKLSSVMMFQEDFGENFITDSLSLYSMSKYIESMTNFEDWPNDNTESDSILTPGKQDQVVSTTESSEKKEDDAKEAEAEDEDEDDAEYIRIPFLRNPYFDNHFDLTNPRQICGKTLEMLGRVFSRHDKDISAQSTFLGQLLQGKWNQSIGTIKKETNMGNLKEQALFYVENLHGVTGPKEDEKIQLTTLLDKAKLCNESLSELVKSKCQSLVDHEKHDLDKFKLDVQDWSKFRLLVREKQAKKNANDKLIAEIKAKKEELKLREQYLYFYDNLHKSKITRINYD